MRNFRLNVAIRITAIAVLITLLVYFVFMTEQYLRSVYLFTFIIILIFEFVWYVDRINRDLSSFLLSLLQNDFTTKFMETGKGKSFNQIYSILNRITRKFEQISSEKEVQHIYLEALVEHIKVGIISYDENERIHLMNGTTKKLLRKQEMLHLKSLELIDKNLTDEIRQIKPGENKLVKVTIKNELLQLNIHAAEFKLHEKYYKLVSIQNIKNELDSNELEAWQKLIRVLTHEIMNSVTPITSLTNTLHQIIEKKSQNHENIDEQTAGNLLKGLEAIQTRSSGLQSFTEAYRKLTKIPTPKFHEIVVKDLIDRVLLLLSPDLKNMVVKFSITENHGTIIGDADLLDQVLINLIKNALEALTNVKKPTILIDVIFTDKCTISIHDNGEGIDGDKIDHIFTPFFTTKKEGSGIGLALSKQILRLHNATINVESEKGRGTSFIISI